MKFLSFICVIIVLVLNSVPCADAHETEETQTVISTAGQQELPSHADDCTPFCHCSCCASTVVVKLTASPAVPFKISTSAYIPHFEGNFMDISLPIFQPPKVI
ncbi:MAG TPA: DUF6660 family protein [Pedobacter sp.]|uniref:DUF6660 family protein n=1 Tax=Pedobacter sp. TaxID=1411316 RepID=UPI002C3AF846|nr:DUF6660 family protein [Pedobacter sp.]HMI04897.1 DUF6660 family protein [Pedobacter sp.]